MAVIYELYDQDRGWEHTQPGWYECKVRAEHIDKYKRHCRWCVTDTNIVSFKFRYERDYIMFTLRWS